jgi:2-amino-4-hydroxy-6-hydroxymethyldihydropteridine diphosphokinase
VSTAYLGLGGNLGNRGQYLADAILALNSESGIRVDKISSVYETLPVGVVDQPEFLNLVVQLGTSLTAHELLTRCLQIEKTLGRVRAERWGPRTIDLDVLWYDGVTMNEADLVLPHPRMKERAFVLVPLAEIAPELSLDGVPIKELVAGLDRSGLRLLGALESVPQ